MIELIQTEFAKLKRQKIVFTITGVLFLFWAGMTFWTYHVPQESFEELYMKYGSYFAMLLPFLLGLSFIKIYHAEYENNTLKELLQIPVSLSRLFYAKILFLFLVAVIIMLANCLLVAASSMICGVGSIDIYQIGMLIKFFLLIALTMPFTIFPVFLVTVLASGNTIFPSAVCFIYSLAGLMGISQLAGIHPISSLLNILFDSQISIASDETKWVCVANIMIFVLISAIFVHLCYGIKLGDKYK